MPTPAQMSAAMQLSNYNAMLSSPIVAAAQFATAGLQNVIQRSLMSVWNTAALNAGPDPRSLIEAMQRGLIRDSSQFTSAMAAHGITFQDRISLRRNAPKGWGPLWRAVLEASYPYPTPDVLVWNLIWDLAGVGGYPAFRELLMKSGHGDPKTSRFLLQSYTPASPEQIMYQYGTATDATIIPRNIPDADKAWMASRAVPIQGSPEQRIFREEWHSRVGTGDALRAFWRNLPDWNEATLVNQLRKSGSLLNRDLQAAATAAKPLPGPNVIIDFATRNADTERIVQLHGLDKGLTDDTRKWLDWHGFGWKDDTMRADARGRRPTMSELIWRSHWLPIPFGQVLLASTRLSPRNVGKWRRICGDNVQQFEDKDVREALGRTGIPEGLQSTAQALGYQTLGWRAVSRIIRIAGEFPDEIKRILRNYAPQDANVSEHVSQYEAEQLRDSGLSPPDTAVMQEVARLTTLESFSRKERSLTQSLNKTEIGQWRAMYSQGLVGNAKLQRELVRLGYTGVQSQQVADLEERNRLMDDYKVFVGRIKADYFAGEYTVQEARVQLIKAGMIEERAFTLARKWESMFHRRKRELSTAQIFETLRSGLMSVQAATVRLQNIGWTGVDTMLLLQDAAAKNAKALAKAQSQTAAQIQKQVKATQVAGKQLMGQLARMTPPSAIKRLYQRNVWTVKQVRDRLAAMGYDMVGIRTFLQEATPFHDLNATQLAALLKADVIDEQEYLDHLAYLGYNDNVSNELLSLVKSGKEATATKAAETAAAGA